jgi:hypothetical protein
VKRVVSERELDAETLALIAAAGKQPPDGPVVRSSWEPDFEIPLFNHDLDYLGRDDTVGAGGSA